MAADAGTPDAELSEPGSDDVTCSAESSAADDEAADHDTALDDSDEQSEGATSDEAEASHARLAMIVGLVAVVGLATLVGWLGFTSYQLQQAKDRRQLFVEVGRQGAINLTTIDWQHADADVKRVLDSATGTFYDDFSKRQQPFIEVVKKAQATSKGTITEAGLESESGDEAQVLVAVSVKTSNIGAADQEPRAWRMRISVHKDGDGAKISNVQFVP